MKTMTFLVAVGLLAACSSPTDEQTSAQSAATTPAAPEPATAEPAIEASATGTVESVDMAVKTITIAHGPVAELNWPAMTMTFQAPNADLSEIKRGDQIAVEFTSTGMDGTITSITRP